MKSNLENQHVLITGASGGIGLATTKKFLQQKANVSAHYFTQQDQLKTVLDNYKSSLNILYADLREEKDTKLLFSKATDRFGRIDILICNAGIAKKSISIQDMTLEQWNETLTTNLTSIFLSMKYYFKNLINYPQDSAVIVLIGSTAGLFGESGHIDYASSKSALNGMLLSSKNEIVTLATKGRVNMVNPGWTITPMTEKSLKNPEFVKKVLQTVPLQKIATTIDIANIIIFLSSNELSGHITGQSITVAGGMEGRVLFDKENIVL